MAGLLVVGLSLPSLASLHRVWMSYDYSHGYLVLALTVFLAFQSLRRDPLTPAAPSWTGFAFLALLVGVIVVARTLTVESVELLALPFAWMAAMWALAGSANARRVGVPLAYLCVAIPIWDVLVEPLRGLTIRVVSAWIHTAGLPASIEGNLIHVPSGTFEVAGGCAGLRYTLVALALASFSGIVNRRRWAANGLLVGAALILALVGNWVRVFVTVVAGHSPEAEVFIFVRDHHSLFGWVVFLIFLSPLFYLNRVLEMQDAPVRAVEREATSTAGVRHRGVVYASVVFLALTIWLTRPVDGADSAISAPLLEIPSPSGWTRSATWEDWRLPVFSGATAQAASWDANGRARVGVYVATYAVQHQGEEVVSLANMPAGSNSVVLARRAVTAEAASGATLQFEEFEVSDLGEARRLVWVSFRIAGNPTTSRVGAKLLQLVGAMRARRDAQVIVLTAACETDCADAQSALLSYAAVATEPLFEVAEQSLHRTDSLREPGRLAAE